MILSINGYGSSLIVNQFMLAYIFYSIHFTFNLYALNRCFNVLFASLRVSRLKKKVKAYNFFLGLCM